MQSDVLDTVIGVVFVWFLLSVFLSAVGDGVALVFRARAKHLWYGIADLLDPATNPMTASVLKSPLWLRRDVRPGTSGATANTPGQVQAVYEEMAPTLVEIAASGRKSKVTHVPPRQFADAVVRLSDGVPTLASIANSVSGNPQLQQAIDRAAQGIAASEQVAAAKKVIESWFEAKMDQLSALYRRQSRKLLAVVALPLVVFTNANAIEIFSTLRQDAALRDATVSAAVNEAALDDIQAAVDATCNPTTTTTIAARGASTTTTVDPLENAIDKFRCGGEILDRAATFRVGLAWDELKKSHPPNTKEAEYQKADLWPYARHAIGADWGYAGRALTWIALLFGAQFWFDVLRRLTGLRSVLKGEQEPTS